LIANLSIVHLLSSGSHLLSFLTYSTSHENKIFDEISFLFAFHLVKIDDTTDDLMPFLLGFLVDYRNVKHVPARTPPCYWNLTLTSWHNHNKATQSRKKRTNHLGNATQKEAQEHVGDKVKGKMH
jgi:hypothetical protein